MNTALNIVAFIPAAIGIAALASPLFLFWLIIDDALNGSARLVDWKGGDK